MRFISDLRIFRSRIAHVLALGGVITTSGCKDSTAPEKTGSLSAQGVTLSRSAAVDDLGSLGASLDDMTGWSVAGLNDAKAHESIVGILNGLKGHLQSGKVAACQDDIAAARSFIESLSEQQRTEIGAVGVTLDLIQSALDKAAQ